MKKLFEYPYLILIIGSILAVSAIGMYEQLMEPNTVVEETEVTWQTYLTSAGEGYINQTIALATAIHTMKEQASGITSVPPVSPDDTTVPVMAVSKNQTVSSQIVSPADGDEADDTQEQDEEQTAEQTEETVSEDSIVFQTVEDDYFDDALFIGDSRTDGFRLYSNLPNITVYAHKGFQVYTAFERKLIQTENGKVTVPEALEQNKGKFKKIYMMFGLNEMGWGSDELFAQAYYYLIDEAKAANPDAVVYIQSIIHVSKEESERQTLFTNAAIDSRNELLKKIADDENVVYLDLNEIFTDEEGNLPEGFSGDGIHLKAEYIELWKLYLKAHAIVR